MLEKNWELIKRNWIAFLGVAFIFSAFLFALKIAFDEGWIPEEGKIFIGLFISATILLGAFYLYTREARLIAEVLGALGGSMLFATFAYASFISSVQWSTNTLLISLVALSTVMIILAHRFKLRTLVDLSITGALLTPIIIRAGEGQIWPLFFYGLVVNGTALYLSLANRWNETRFISFFATLVLYTVYYVLFSRRLQ